MTPSPDDDALLALFQAIASSDLRGVARILASSDEVIASQAICVAATRQNASTYFLDAILHYVYAGDTGLHIAAAAYQGSTARLLVARGASARARNRRGAEPLHYAADGFPNAAHWDPGGQREIIDYLVAIGADANSRDAGGVTPLHRAVRTRSSAAVQALLHNGAKPKITNKRGSTPLHLAVQNTGRGDSGSAAAKNEQREIITLLLRSGANPKDTDANGKTVAAAATSSWIRELLT